MKTASKIFMTFCLLVFFTGISYSQVATDDKPGKTSAKTETFAAGKFVDTNKNGVCDNHEAKCAGAKGKNYVDKDGNGKCDNCGSAGNCKGTGNCCGKSQGCGSGCGKGPAKGNCCGHGPQPGKGCSNQGSAPSTEPKK